MLLRGKRSSPEKTNQSLNEDESIDDRISIAFYPPRHFCLYTSTPPVNTLTGGVENYVGGVTKFRGASHPPQANLCTRPCIRGILILLMFL